MTPGPSYRDPTYWCATCDRRRTVIGAMTTLNRDRARTNLEAACRTAGHESKVRYAAGHTGLPSTT